MASDKQPKDFRKYIIDYKLTGQSSELLPKARVPQYVFKYLIENELLNIEHYAFFQVNHFREGQFSSFVKSSGDLITPKSPIPKEDQHRFYQTIINGKQYYICNQWNKPSIENFNAYINNNFGDFIAIHEAG